MTYRAMVTALCSALLACSTEENSKRYPIPLADDFSAVSAVLQVSCGTLDCHGSPPRSLRVYGRYGLRENGADVTGGDATTPAEVRVTYESLVTVDPEGLERIALGQGVPESWLVLSKGTAKEAHEGGPALPRGSAAEACLLSWLDGTVDVDTCVGWTFGPIPRAGEEW